jgi:UDP-N-acetylglucosamine--N-acetylmuramyl-(pentapeptide) pyrophosphoryl-undecaprenol N-acetylglucosamine transferase
MRIVLTGGGTGGHLVPLVAIAKEIKGAALETEFLFLGPKGGMEVKFMSEAGISMKYVMAGKWRRYFSFFNFIDFFKIILGIFQSLFHLLIFMPDVIFSKGGYASFPVVLAGWIYRIPILIHESDSAPGLANKMLGKMANRIAVSYPEAEKEFPSAKVVLTGNPLRRDIANGNAQKARELFHLSESKKTIFVYGGSLGARIINDKITNILPELIRNYQVIHQTGKNNFEAVKHKAGELGIKVGRDNYFPIDFVGEELKDILSVSDLVISRAGANSISEIAANGKPSIIIPIENSNGDHQRKNAYALEKMGGCIVLEENNLGGHLLMSRIREILDNDVLAKKMGENARSFYHFDAAEKIAEGGIDLAR